MEKEHFYALLVMLGFIVEEYRIKKKPKGYLAIFYLFSKKLENRAMNIAKDALRRI
jgi:hypothetical protein